MVVWRFIGRGRVVSQVERLSYHFYIWRLSGAERNTDCYAGLFFYKLCPMVHYVLIREDLTDLIDKIEYLDKNPKLYRQIAENRTMYARDHFTKEKVQKYLYEKIMRYGLAR